MTDRSVTVRLRAEIAQYQRQLATAAGDTKVFASSVDQSDRRLASMEGQAGRTGSEIDKLSGRLRVALDVVTLGAPAITAFGAAGVGAMVALSAEAGAAAGALGVTLLAVHGLSDGLKALDNYQAAPTTENLAKLNLELGKLGPTGAAFVRYLDSIEPKLKDLQNTARDGVLPGAEQGIEDLMTKLPQVRMLIRRTSTEVGNLLVEGGDAVSGGKLDDFLQYLHKDGVQILDDTAKTVGNLALAGLNLVAAFAPLQTDFSGGLLDWSRDIEKASEGLDSNAGVQELIAYIDDVGPKAVDTLGSIANAALQIVEATAPLGGPSLEVLGKVADVIASIADSDLGTPIFVGMAALALYNRTLALTATLSERAAAGGVSVTGSLARNATAQYQGLRALPGMYREVAAAEMELAAAEKVADAARTGYIARLQTYNRQVAAGSFTGLPTVRAGAQGRVLDDLGKLELANRGVQNATERAAAAEAQQRSALRQTAAEAGKTGALIGGLALAQSGLAEQTGLANTANLAMLGTLGGPLGAAIGAGIGGILDFKAAYDSLNQSISDLDTAASGTDITALEQQIAAKKKELEDLQAGPSMTRRAVEGALSPVGLGSLLTAQDQLGASKADDLANSIAAAEKQLAGLRNGSIQTFNPVQALAGAIGNAADMAEKQATSTQDAIDAMREQRSEALRAANAQLNYQAAIDDANKAIKENGKDFDITTEKGRANRQALYALADGWNQQSDAAKNAKGSLQQARANFIQTAEAMGASADQAHNLAKRLFEIPSKRVTTVSLDGADSAIGTARSLKSILDSLHSKDINIALHYQTIGNKPKAPIPGAAGADGMTVPGPRYPYGDKMLILAAPGERVISNRRGQADKHAGLLDAINADRMADGGTVGGPAYHSMIGGNGGGPAVQIWTDGVYSVAKALKALKAELDAASKAVDRDKKARDDLVAAEQSFMSSVSGAYSKADLFSGGLSEFDTGAQANANDTAAAQVALSQASGHGLDGPLYQALAASGNLTLLQQFAGLSADQIQIRENEFSAQSNAQGSLATSASVQAGFVQAIADQTKELKEAQRERRNLERAVKAMQDRLDKLPDKVEAGARAGVGDQQKRTATRRRTG